MIVVAILVGVFYTSLLRALAVPLTRGDELSDTDFLVFLRAARGSLAAYEFAAEFANQRPDRRVLILHDYVRRAEAIGATPSFVAGVTEALIDQGVPDNQIEVIGDGSAITATESLLAIKNWLATQPESASAIIVTHRFLATARRTVADQVMQGGVRNRVSIIGFSVRGIDESNWWRSATGIKTCIDKYLLVVHLYLFGDRRPAMEWDPDVYEQALIDSRRNA